MSLIMPGGGRTVNWGIPGGQQQMPPTRGPEQLAWQQQNPSQPQKPGGMTPSKPGPGRPSVPMQNYAPGQAQSQQSPYSSATPYGQPRPQNQADNPWGPGGTNQQQASQPDLTQYMSPGNPMRGGNSYQQAPQQAGQPQWTQALPYGGQNAGIPSFQFRATDFMGNQFSDPGAFTAQQGAMAQALNQQRAQGIGQGQFGPLNPQLAYQQGAEMVQGGWQNPFAAPQPENQIRRLIDYPGPMPQPPGAMQPGGPTERPRMPTYGDRPILMAPGSPGDRERPPVTPGTAQPIPPQVAPPSAADADAVFQRRYELTSQAQALSRSGLPPEELAARRATLANQMRDADEAMRSHPAFRARLDEDREVMRSLQGQGFNVTDTSFGINGAPRESIDAARRTLRDRQTATAPQQSPAGRRANMNAFTRADAPPGQRFDNVAYEAQLRTLRDEVAAKTRAGNRNGAAQSQRSLDSLMERRDYLRAQAEDNVAGANQALQAIGRTRSAARPAEASSQSDRPGDRVVGGFNYSAAGREYEAGRQKRVQSPANQRWLASMSPANRRAYGFMQ